MDIPRNTAADPAEVSSPLTSAGSTPFIDWATPAICDVLAEHRPTGGEYVNGTANRIVCFDFTRGHYIADDWQAWRDHVAPLIAARIESARSQRDAGLHATSDLLIAAANQLAIGIENVVQPRLGYLTELVPELRARARQLAATGN